MKRLALALVLGQVVSPSVAAERVDLARLDLCVRVPGDEVAEAVGATLRQARRFNDSEGTLARCVYFVTPAGAAAAAEKVFAVEALAAADFVDVRPYVEAPIHEVAGLGDGAWAYRDADSHDRLRLYVLRRGVVTVDVTGEDEEEVRKVAAVAIAKF